MNLKGEIIKGNLEQFIEDDLKEMSDFPVHLGATLTELEDLKHSFVITQSRIFERVLDIANLYVNNNKYEETETEENSIRENFIKCANMLIETNQKAIDKLFKGHEVSSFPITKLYNKDILLDLIKWAESKDRLRIQQFLISTSNYSDFYGDRLDKEYQKYDNNFLDSVMTFAEATKQWGLGDSTLRMAVNRSTLVEGKDYRKSGSTWLITKEAMKRVYGEPKNK